MREHFGPCDVAIVDTECHHGYGTQDVYWLDRTRFSFPSTRTPHPVSRHRLPLRLGGPGRSAPRSTFTCRPAPRTKVSIRTWSTWSWTLSTMSNPTCHQIRRPGQHFFRSHHGHGLSAQGYARLTDMLGADTRARRRLFHPGRQPYVNLGLSFPWRDQLRPVREAGLRSGQRAPVGQGDGLYQEICDEFCADRKPEPPRANGKRVVHTAQDSLLRLPTAFTNTDRIRAGLRHCRGVLKYETESTRNPLGLGVEATIGPAALPGRGLTASTKPGRSKAIPQFAAHDGVGKNYLVISRVGGG